MVLYKNLKRARLTLQERLNKNKQYLKRRLLRISKRAGWLKRKLSKRLKYIIKARQVHAYYSSVLFKKQYAQKFVKIKKTKIKKNNTTNKFAKIKLKYLTKTNTFSIAKLAKKLLTNKHNHSFQYFHQ